MTEKTYLVYSTEKDRWWGPGGAGYVQALSRAGRYSRAEAMDICTKALIGTSTMLGRMPELPVPLEDAETIAAWYRKMMPDQTEAWL